MILYNTTFCIDTKLHDEFIEFLKLHYIPAAESSGMHAALVLAMRGGYGDDNNTRTVALQMRAPSEKALEQFRASHLPTIYNTIYSRWGTGVAMFESTLDIIHDSER